MNNIKAVLFDLDDTLFDREAAQSMALELIVKRFPGIFNGLEMEDIEAAFIESDIVTSRDFDAGAPSEGLRDIRSRLFLKLLGIQEDYAEAITEVYVRDYPTVNTPVAGAVPLVKELRNRFKAGVVSNGFPDVQYRKLETIGLLHEFSCIVLSEEIGIRKPLPGIFTHAALLLQVEPSECLYVGNSYTSDVVGARNAGMTACWLNREVMIPDNKDIQADYIISDLKELLGILR